jgi:hypothetical protein
MKDWRANMDNEVNINHDKEYRFLQERIILYEDTK